MWGVTSNAPDLTHLKPSPAWAGWGPGALYISHPPPLAQGFAPLVTPHAYNPIDRLRAPRHRAFTSTVKGLNS